ncbi:unnamed protein product [Dovyalis caffra]|uniref:Sulfite exporter TauE/SafE family protein n=1 Tax=Dovyalis caffra TaxID=77055 RepID=A0AAV1SSI7_9ROSI|nr:unnamed protein product [Dovyalis caffra]
MAGVGSKWWCSSILKGKILICLIVATSVLVVAVAEPSSKQKGLSYNGTQKVESHHGTISQSSYKHVWPDMKFGWKIVVGTIIAFFGAACGSVGGVGGGMITGAAASTVLYNLKLRHPTLEMPIIDYDLALLFQPMLTLGVSIGVTLNVLFADWMITILLLIIFIENIYWKNLGILVTVWVIILALQIGKIPVAVGVTSYEAFSLYKGRREIASKGEASNNWPVHKLVFYCFIGVVAGIVGGMLGLGGGFILGPLFLEMGIPPQLKGFASFQTGGVGTARMIKKFERNEYLGQVPGLGLDWGGPDIDYGGD